MTDSGVCRATRTVLRVPLKWTLAPELASLLVRDDAQPFALIGRWAGGGALIGSEPVRVACAGDDPFALLDEQPAVATPAPAGAVAGGWFGYLGYELAGRLEAIGAGPPGIDGLPPFALAFYDHLLHLDADGRWWFEALWSADRANALRERLRVLTTRAAGRAGGGADGPDGADCGPPQTRPFSTEAWQATPGPAGHQLAVHACRERIYAGDLFQASICTRLESRMHGNPLDLFLTAATELAPDRAAFLAGPWGAVASLSPELFLERVGRRVRSAPIKGTRRRPADPSAAARERDALLGSAKDRAENVMIVDLVRNDLGRVCVPGSIAVQELARAREHTGVWHLVSEVAGVLARGVGDGPLVRAAFPPGSVTGAPKVAALNVIAELESTARHLYTGAIGFASPVTGLELSVAIRTFEFRGDRVWLGVGGGIVADSDPVEEAAECMTKAGPLLNAIGATAPQSPPRLKVPRPRRRGPRPVPRPDPAAGVFETLLVVGGRPVALERHLSRLSAGVRTLYGSSLGAGLADELGAAAWGRDRVRMRVNYRPGPGSGRVDIEVTDLAARQVPVRLIPRTVPGGLGEHKWIDRRLLDSLGGDGEPLLCDLDGFVLEAGRASVFVVLQDGRLLTPPADGRILPGVTRARVLELASAHGFEVAIRPIGLDELTGASELLLTGALGGVEPAHIDGLAPSTPSPVTAQLAEALRSAERRPLGGVRTNLYKTKRRVILR